MRIGINALYWVPNAMGGTQTYLNYLLKYMLKINSKDEFIIFLNSKGAKDFDISAHNLKIHICPVSGNKKINRFIWENIMLQKYVIYYHLDILHSLGYLTPLRINIPNIITVHDMVHYYYPKEIEYGKLLLWKLLLPLSLRKATRIISVSNSVKNDIIKFFPWTDNKIIPILHGVDDRLFNENIGFNNQFENMTNDQFILAVASPSIHKNLSIIIEAFKIISQNKTDLKLIFVGMLTKTSSELSESINDPVLKSKIKFLGRVSDESLVQLYCRALALIFPSFYEGFGLPLLEAMACNCPVIASNRSSIPEVVKDAALLFNADNVNELVENILNLINSPNMIHRYKKLGKLRARELTWEKTAINTLKVYKECIG